MSDHCTKNCLAGIAVVFDIINIAKNRETYSVVDILKILVSSCLKMQYTLVKCNG